MLLSFSMYKCTYILICCKCVNILNPTNIYRYSFIMCKCNSSLIHYSYIALEYFMHMQFFMTNCIGMFFWVLIVYSIYFCSLDYNITIELETTQYSTRISCKVRIPRTPNTHHYPSLLYMTQCSSADKRLSNTLSRNSTHYTDIYSLFFNCFTYCESIDDCTEHSHMISCCPIKSTLL